MGVQIEEKSQVLYRKLNLFEIGLFFAGIAVIFVGFFLLYKQYILDGYYSWGLLQGVFLWLILIVIIIIAAILENVKEGLFFFNKKHHAEDKIITEGNCFIEGLH